MKWLTAGSTPRQKTFDLYNEDEKLLSLSLQTDNGALRISTNEERRVFLFKREGFLRTSTVLRNEYGVIIGKAILESSENNLGAILLGTDKYNYTIESGQKSAFTIYKNNEALISCDVPLTQNNIEVLMLALCWYEFVSVEGKHLKVYA